MTSESYLVELSKFQVEVPVSYELSIKTKSAGDQRAGANMFDVLPLYWKHLLHTFHVTYLRLHLSGSRTIPEIPSLAGSPQSLLIDPPRGETQSHS